MKKIIYLSFILLFFGKTYAQNVTINPTGITPDMSGTHLRMSYDSLIALPAPSQGDFVYDTTFKCLRVYTDGKWLCSYQDPNSYSPNILQTTAAGGTGNDSGTSIAIDASGNIYVAGTFSDTASFELTSKISIGSLDVFIAKYNKHGVLQWVQSAGGTEKDSVQSIAVDGNGNVYLTGIYKSAITFETTTIYATGDNDIFLAKYNASGVFQWARTAGGQGSDAGTGVVTDAGNNVYVVGFYSNTAAFGAFSKTSLGMRDIFLAKYNSSGIPQWVVSAGGANDDFGSAIAIDASANIYITGSFKAGVKFGSISAAADPNYYDVFVAKYDPVALNWAWVKEDLTGSNNEYSQRIAVDLNGNIFVTGYYYGSVSFASTSKASKGGADMFIIKYNSLGASQWLQTAGGTGFDSGQGLVTDTNGNVYVTGFFSYPNATFGTIVKDNRGLNDAYVVRYEPNGSNPGVKTFGSLRNDVAKDIATDSAGNIFITGSYSNTVVFDKNAKTSQGGEDIFIIRIDK
jgi:hypothetical protein